MAIALGAIARDLLGPLSRLLMKLTDLGYVLVMIPGFPESVGCRVKWSCVRFQEPTTYRS